MRAKIVEALVETNGGPLNASTLRTAAFGGGMVNAVVYADVLRDLERDGVIRSCYRAHWVGRAGAGCRVYTLPVVIQRDDSAGVRVGDMPTPRMSAIDWARVLETVQAELERAQESAGQSSEVASTWRRIATTLASELDPAREADTEDQAAG